MKTPLLRLFFLLSMLLVASDELLAQSLLVPGGVNYVQVGDVDVTGNQITVEALVTTNGGGVNIVSKHTNPSNVNYLMRPGSAEITTTNGYVNAVSGFVLTPGVCYHLAFTYNGTSLDYYVNGCLASSTPHTGNLVTNNLITAIGDQSSCQCESWNGYIDEVRIWNVARTQAQIQANMFDLPNPTTQGGLLAYYKFDGNYLNLQGNAAFNGNPIGAPQLVANNACQNVDLSFQNSVAVTDVSCNGGADGSVTITSTGGHPNYQYSADGVNYFPINSIGNLPVGNGVVWASSGAGGCIEQIPITIGEPAPITTSVTGTGPSCLGNDGDADLTVNGGTPPYSYLWSSGSTQQDPTNLAVGNNTVTITDANGCTATESITLNAPPAVTATATGTDPTCYAGNNGTGDITVTSGTAPFSFVWSTGSTAEDPTNLVAGANDYTITDANSCTYTDSVVLSQPNSLLSSATATYVSSAGACDASAVANPTGGTPPYTYLWSNGATTQSVSGLCQGVINLTVTDANGCVTTQPLNVNLPQCLTDVDFYTWVQAGQPANGNWVVQSGGTQVLQTVNGNPSFFITPADYINVRMNGRFRTTDNDDDWMGIVFGFKEPLGASDTYDMWLFDWKQESQASGGFTGQEGFALTHVVGTIPTNQYAATFWGHTTTPQFNVVATNYGNNGWNQNTWYDVEVVYTVNRAIILVDGDTIFDVVDCFEPGRFGFYNYSQRQVTYADFTYELFADFVVETPEICAGDTAQFTFLEQCGNFNNLSQFDELHWDFGDGNTEVVSNINLTNVNPDHVYQNGGNYQVRLIALDTLGCRDTVFKNILVYQNPIADFTFTDQCFQDFTQFTDASQQGDFPIVGYAWLINGNQIFQQNTSYQFPAPATYVVGLGVQDAYGCIDTVTHPVPIHVLPTADFIPIDDCFQPNYPFEDASVITNGSVVGWQWDFSDGGTATVQNPTHTFAAYGQYDVELIAVSDQGCGDTLTQTIVLHEIPTPGFEIPNICQLEPMQLIDTSSVTDGTIVSWDYDLGDGNNSTDQNSSHLYQNAGNITITQTVTTSFGCEATVQRNAVVRPKPQANFAALDVCLDDDMFFTDQSTVSPGSVEVWDWDFDDGSIDSIADPTHLYTNAGTYDVQLIVESDFGCKDTIVQQVDVFQLPVADFSFQNVCLADAAIFTDQSTSGSGSVSSWNWDLGDGSTSSAQGPVVHDYATPNTYTVQLIVETGVGCTDTVAQDIVVYPMPEADFVADSVCFGLPTNFTDLSTILTGSISDYYWNFGFNGSSSQANPSNVFPQTGYHDVTLVLTSDFGCKDTITKPVRVYVLPEPEFTHNDTCFEDNVSFANQTAISEGTIAAYLWDFGDAQTSTVPSPVHHYGTAGFYTTDLIAVSNYGCIDSVSHQVEIYPLPTVAFTPVPNEGCQPLTVTFNNQTDIANGYFISAYNWQFGQGDISTSEDPQTLYPDSGLYTVTLIVTTANGCDDTLTIADAVDVWPRPIAGFETDKDEYLMYFPNVHCIDLSVGATEWFWDFDDGSQSQDQNPEHEYQQDGVYQIIQTVYNDYGCDDVTSRRVIVKPAITFYIPNSFTPNNDGLNETFGGYGEGIEEYQMWIYDRWGENLFYSATMDQQWDGTYKGKQVEAGMYVYKFYLIAVDGNDHEYTGGVHLLR